MDAEGRWPEDGRRRVVISAVRPSVDGGRYAVKRTLGDRVEITTDLLIDGHDRIAARLHVRHSSGPGAADAGWTERVMTPAGPHAVDRWQAELVVDRLGIWEYRVEAWVDAFATWRHNVLRKVEAGQDVSVELAAGAALIATTSARAEAAGADVDARMLAEAAQVVADPAVPSQERAARAVEDEVALVMARHPDRGLATLQAPPLELLVERERARFSAWYELFPRSFGAGGRHGTLRDAAEILPYIAEMNFDVVYLPPIHPIGRTHRKGPNNSLVAAAGDPGSPWAIGAAEGGHDALHPELGTLADFALFVDRARVLGLEVALDIALQVSPDHPWVREHPDWFVRRADGSFQYAENPPKKYQDVYPFDFQCAAWPELWQALAGVFFTWIDRGVRVFRVDNPHTKPIPFWRWCLAEVRRRHPDVVFLSEAFTRPLLLEELAKIGFSQSYTYFTWRMTGGELRAYLEDLVAKADYLRPNFWPNTPDILPEHLQVGGRPAFAQRAILAATLAASYGVYGPAFELCDARALPGREEYADSEKYQLRSWSLTAPASLRHLLSRLNWIRREHPALHDNRTLHFHPSDDDALLCYSKTAGRDAVLCVVNLDPFHRRSGWVELDLAALGLAADTPFQVHDLIGDARYLWQGARNYVEIDPAALPAQVFAVRRRGHREHSFEYYL